MEKDQRAGYQGDGGYKQSNHEHGPGPSGRINWMDCTRSLLPFSSLEFLRDLWIAEVILVKIKQMQTQAVLHLALAQIVQVRLPVAILGQIFRYMRGQKNMPGIATIQHPLGNVDPRSCKVRFVVHIGDSV